MIQDTRKRDELVSVPDLAAEFEMGESTAWLLIARSDLTRYRRPGHGKRTFIRRGDFQNAYETPIVVDDEPKKAAA